MKVLRKIFALEKFFLLELKLEVVEKVRKKVEEDKEDEMRNEKERIEFYVVK